MFVEHVASCRRPLSEQAPSGIIRSQTERDMAAVNHVARVVNAVRRTHCYTAGTRCHHWFVTLGGLFISLCIAGAASVQWTTRGRKVNRCIFH